MTTTDRPTRRATLIVASTTLSAAEISGGLGLAPDYVQQRGEVPAGARVPRPAVDSAWEIASAGDATTALQTHVDAVLRRAEPWAAEFAGLRERGCVVKLGLMQWIGPDDAEGPGFGLTASQVAFLAQIGAFVDVDQYRDE